MPFYVTGAFGRAACLVGLAGLLWLGAELTGQVVVAVFFAGWVGGGGGVGAPFLPRAGLRGGSGRGTPPRLSGVRSLVVAPPRGGGGRRARKAGPPGHPRGARFCPASTDTRVDGCDRPLAC